MANAIFFCSFKLNEGKAVQDFLSAAEELNNGFISKQKGYVSWKQVVDGSNWADIVTFETMEDAHAFLEAAETPNELSTKFFSFVDLASTKVHVFSVEKEYK